MVDLDFARPFGPLPGGLPGPRNRRVSVFLIGLLLAGGILLHSAPLPLSHAEITLDGSLGPKGPLAGPEYVIGHDLGQVRGSNLFHSFGQFNVLTGESATFTGPNTIENILGRVTGGQQSFIDGLLRSTIPGANLFLLNPSGVLFGPNATLDVSGSFHVSTADYLRLSDGGRFHADLAQPTVLTTAPVEAFGFLGPNPASISLQGSSLSVPTGQTLSLLGGEIEITGASVKAEHGQIHLASVGSAGEILRPGSGQVLPGASGQPPGLDVSSFAHLGPITASSSANLAVSSPLGAGTVVIRGGRLRVDHASINAQTLGDGDGSPVGQDIQVREEVLLTNGASLSAESRGAGRGSSLQITAGNLVQIKEGSSIRATPLGPGDGGSITVKAGRLELAGGGVITSNARGSGHGGNLEVTVAESIHLAGNGAITAGSLERPGMPVTSR